jgi:fumarylacetoacetase
MTIDQSLTSWVSVPPGSDFPIQNLPYGVFSDGYSTRCGIAIGTSVFDLAQAEAVGVFMNTGLSRDTFRADSLNTFLSHSRGVWSAVRSRVADLLTSDNAEGQTFCEEHDLIIDHEVQLHLPVVIGDYVDFYSSLQHATNVGRMFRPDDEPLLENWKHLPVGYHGRSGTIVADGTPITRPAGQHRASGGPSFGPTEKLDIELEVGFITGMGHDLGESIDVDDAEHHIFGLCLVNDWSARDIQAWEYVPLGPFLGKSFATTISPWIVPIEALAPFRVAAQSQKPAPLPYLRADAPEAIAIDLRVDMTPAGGTPTTIIETSFTNMYWTMAQQLAHATVNGATVRPGDLFASGTVSGPDPAEFGSLLERSWNGTQPITLADGSQRTFLEDGDTVTMTGRCAAPGAVSLGFGTCTGTVRGSSCAG